MEKADKCSECGIGFPQIGTITSKESLLEHEITPHEVHCKECGKFFVSSVHLKYHLEFNHDARCIDLLSYCEGNCSEKYALEAEVEGN